MARGHVAVMRPHGVVTMVGGDNASRGTNIGLVLGAYHGIDAIPRQFKDSLNQYKRCKKMLMTLPLLKGTVREGSNEL